jgi:hypothetical protein
MELLERNFSSQPFHWNGSSKSIFDGEAEAMCVPAFKTRAEIEANKAKLANECQNVGMANCAVLGYTPQFLGSAVPPIGGFASEGLPAS